MQMFYDILRDNLWQALASIISFGAFVAVAVNFISPISSEDSLKKKTKRALLILVVTFIITGSIVVLIAIGPKDSDSVMSTSAVTASASTGFVLPSTWQQILDDPLTASHHDSQWETDATCIFLSNAYEINSSGPNYCAYGNAEQDHFTDLAYSVEISIDKGELGGLIFRLTRGDYYAFCITTKGTYQVLQHSGANGGNDISIAGAFSPVIHQGFGQNNTLEVIVRGSMLQFWINGKLISSNYDSTYNAGTIGVMVGGAGTATMKATFDHLQVWVPQR